MARSSGGASGSALQVQGGQATLAGCTISGNSCEGPNCGGGAVFVKDRFEGAAAGIEIARSIVAENTGGSPADISIYESGSGVSSLSRGYNVLGDVDADVTTDSTDLTDVGAPMLSPLGDHGGPTDTRVPYPDSPALELVPHPALDAALVDQRGEPRRTSGFSDSGAVERVTGDPTP